MQKLRDEIIMELNGRGLKTEPVDIEKNGIPFHGIADRSRGNVCPVCYAEDLVRRHGNLSACEFADIIAEFFGSDEAHAYASAFDTESLLSRESFERNIRIDLCGNVSGDAVHRSSPLKGLMERLIIKTGNGKMIGTVKITGSLLDKAGISEEEAWKMAERNTEMNVMVRDLGGVVQDLSCGEIAAEECMMPIYVVTSADMFRGCSCLFTEKAVSFLKNRLGTDRFIVLPSSIHELLVLPDDTGMDMSGLVEMVKEINRSTVAPEERLADDVYAVTADELVA